MRFSIAQKCQYYFHIFENFMSRHNVPIIEPLWHADEVLLKVCLYSVQFRQFLDQPR